MQHTRKLGGLGGSGREVRLPLVLVRSVDTMKPTKSISSPLATLALLTLALSGCTSSNSGLEITVQSATLDPDSQDCRAYSECLKLVVLIENHAPRDFSMWGDDVLSERPWSAVSKDGQILYFSDLEGPDGIAAGSRGEIIIAFNIEELEDDSNNPLVKLRYTASGFNAEAKIPGYYPAPQISFSKSNGASSSTDFTVTKITNGPVAWSDLVVTCTGSDPGFTTSGDNVRAGDTINCPSASTKITIVHSPTETLLYSQNL